MQRPPSDATIAVESSPEDERRNPDWDVRFGTAHYGALVLSFAGSAIASLVAVAILTRTLRADGLGQVLAILAAAQLAQLVGVSWTAVSLGALGGAEYIRTGRIANVFWSRAAILTVNLLLLIVMAPWWVPLCASILRLEHATITPILVYLGVAAVWTHMQQALLAGKRIAAQAALTLFERVLMLAIVLVLAATGFLSVQSVVAAYIAAAAAATVLALIPLRRLITPVIAFRERAGHRILGFSIPLLPGAIANFAGSSYLSTFFLAPFVGAAAVAAFGVAYQIHGAVMQLPVLAGMILQPYFVTLHAAERARETGPLFTSFVQLSSLLMGAFGLVIAAAGAPLMQAAFGRDYRDTAPLLWPLMATAALSVPAVMAWLPLATATQKSYILAVNALSTAVFNLVLHAVLTPRFGSTGAAWSLLLASCVTAVVTVWCMRRERLPDCLPSLLAASPPAVAALVALRGDVLEPILAGCAVLIVVTLLQRQSLRAGARVARELGANALRQIRGAGDAR